MGSLVSPGRAPSARLLVAAVLVGVAGPTGAQAKGGALAHAAPGTILIDTGARTLTYVVDGATAIRYRIAVGRDGKQWYGQTHVRAKSPAPSWRPTPDMRRENPSLPAHVGPGRHNPLGARAIYLGTGYLRIHGTNAPSSIGRAASSGCFRMYNRDVVDLYDRVRVGAPVIVRR